MNEKYYWSDDDCFLWDNGPFGTKEEAIVQANKYCFYAEFFITKTKPCECPKISIETVRTLIREIADQSVDDDGRPDNWGMLDLSTKEYQELAGLLTDTFFDWMKRNGKERGIEHIEYVDGPIKKKAQTN